ncbi:MAG: hypothetical protein JWM56_380 [Candidatus Peribacteria bacterium]|nr:hypothetical protein [Candidatus Peribacteria bacterium]
MSAAPPGFAAQSTANTRRIPLQTAAQHSASGSVLPMPDTQTGIAEQMAWELLHTRYCESLNTAAQTDCLQGINTMTNDEKQAFHMLYTRWLDDLQSQYDTFINTDIGRPGSGTGSAYPTNSLSNNSVSGSSLYSLDQTGWQTATTDYWTTRNNEWVKVQNGALVWSIDNGQTWTSLPDNAWQADDGTWYRLDMNGNLQISTNGGINWTNSTDNMWPGRNGIWYRLNANGQLEMRDGKGGMTAGTLPGTDAASRRQELLNEYNACKNVSPRRYANCIDAYRSSHSANQTTTP